MNWVYRVMGWFFEIPVPLTGNADLISTSRPGREKTRLGQRCRRIPSWAAWMGNHRQGADRIPLVWWCKPRGAAVAFEVSKGPAILQLRSSLSRPGSRWSGYTLFYWMPVVLFWHQKSHPFEELQKCVYSCFFPFFLTQAFFLTF